MIKKVIVAILIVMIVSLCFAHDDDYARRKARMAPAPSEELDAMSIRINNSDVSVNLGVSDGKFNQGTYPRGLRLLFSYPSSPWSSWTMVRVDGTLYCNDSGVSPLPVTTPFTVVPHSGDSSFIFGGFTAATNVRVYQKLQPVYIVYPDTVIGTVFIEYTVINADATAHDVSLLLQLDTMINTNDAAPLATSRGYSGVEEGFRATDPLGMPPFWYAYERGADFEGEQLIGMGILSGWDAVTPDRFIVGQWGRLRATTWDITPTGGSYTDSAVRIYWDIGTMAPGDTARVATYYGLGKELRMGQIVLYPEPVTVSNCEFLPNPFNVLMLFNNSTAMPVSGLTATIELPEGFELTSGELTQPLTPSHLPSGGSGTSNWDVSITPPIPADDTIWFYVDSDELDERAVAYHTMRLPPIDLPPYAELEDMVPLDMTVSACVDQNLIVELVANNDLREHTAVFFVNDDTLGLSDARLTRRGDSLIFTPTVPFASGSTIEYGLLEATDEYGCVLTAPAVASFFYDIEPPYAHSEYPPDEAILGTLDIPELTVSIEDDDRDIDVETISLEVNGVIYDWGHEALSWDGLDLSFNFEAAGMELEDGDTICAILHPVSDIMPDYCDANTMPEPYSWCFRINIIDLWLPDTFAYPGDTIYIDVWVEDLRNMGIVDFDIDIAYFPSVINVIDVETRPMTSGWTLSWSASDGVISVSGSGPELDAGGQLFKIKAFVNERAAGGYSRLDFLRTDFNGGMYATLPVDGFLEILWINYSFLGNLRFFSELNNAREAIAFGASLEATNGFDPGLDLLALPHVPGQIKAYFHIDDPAYPAHERLRRDMRFWGEYPIVWTGYAEYGTEHDTTIVSWSPEYLPPGLFTIRYETYGGEVISLNMHSNSQFKFTRSIDFEIIYDHPVLTRHTVKLCHGWNLISLPNMPSAEITIRELFPTAMTSAFRYCPILRRYVELEEPEVGVGFWIFSADEATVEVGGAAVQRIDMPIYRGWNAIGMPTLSGTSAAITTNPPGLFSHDFIYLYDTCDSRSYISPAGDFETGVGYFILIPENGTITIEDE